MKVPLYARHGIAEVWVIDAATRTTHRFRRPTSAGYLDRDVIPPNGLLQWDAMSTEATSLTSLLPWPPAGGEGREPGASR